MRRNLRNLLYTVPGLVIGGVAATSCKGLPNPGEDLCGPCGEVAKGDVGISGDARLDGFFNAVGTLNTATSQIKADFDANIRALAALYGIDASGTIDAALVGKVTTAIDAEVKANVDGGLTVRYQPPECKADVKVSVDAQAKCEASAKCDAKVNPGEVAVKCEGKCEGTCDAECTGSAECAVDAPSVTCSGTCEGSCQLDTAAKCTGTCHGTCSGECSLKDANGKCQGTCSGDCQGSCELSAAAECSGKCSGKCVTKSGNAKCDAKAECRGTCGGSCTGSCTGKVTPPSASATCEATADCQASASAQGSAHLECTPPQLALDFKLKASAAGNADAQATFIAHIAEVKARGVAIVQGAAKLKLLIQGDTAAGVQSPLEQIKGQISGMASLDALAKFDVPAGRIDCAVAAFGESVKMLGSAATQLGGTVSAQAKFVSYITTGA